MKARLERADAVPDDAELVVTPVTVESTDYNYDAYMDALNQDPEKEYTSENTLLYDIAFMIDEKDADGNLTGKKVEFTPAAGDVNVSIRFKKNQLKNELGVETAEDIEVIHLPLENEVKEAFDSTAEATEITADNIIVQEVENQKVDVNKETVGFRTTDFSVFAFTVDFHYEGKDYSIPGSTQVLLSELIQNLHITVDGTSDGSILDVLQVKEVLFTNEELVKTEKVSGVITYQAEEGLRENVDVGEQDFLITSKKSFASDEIMTIILMDGRVLKVNVTDAQNALDVSVVLYDYDDQTTITIPSDITSDNIVLVVWVGDNGDISTTTGDIPWKVVDMNGIKGQNTPYNITIDSFNRQAWSQDGAISYSSLTPEQKANIKARLVHSTKSVSEFNLGALQNRFWNESEYTTIWNGGFDGFGMSVDHVTGLVTEGRYEINLKKANRKEQDVVFEFEDSSEAGAIDSNYYVLLKGLKLGGNPNQDWDYYYYVVLVNIDGSNPKVYLPVTGYWSDNQQFSENWTNLSATIIKPKGNNVIQTGGRKPQPNEYQEAYVMGDYTFNYEGFVSETDEENHVDRQEFLFTLKKADYEPAKTPEEIVGPGIDFGITADEFKQCGHLQSNFATNNYSGHGDTAINVQPDLSNVPGTSVASKITGNIYYNNPSGAVILTNDNDTSKVGGHTEFCVIEHSTESKIKNTIVDPIINYGAAVSDILINKEPTLTPKSNEIDLTQFPDGITIYLDGDKMKDALAHDNAGEITLNMLPNQVVVFNFDETETLRLGKILCNVGDSQATKEFMAEHLVFNCASVKNLELNESLGMHLVPDSDSKTYVTESSEGWIISGGYFENVDPGDEWHFRYQHLREPKNIYVNFEKKVDGQRPAQGQVFEFDLSVWNASNNAWEPIETLTNNRQNIKYTIQPGEGRIFRIKEKGKSASTEGNYKKDIKEYFVLARYYLDVSAHAAYYDSFQEAKRVLEDDLLEDDGNTISKIVFENETAPETEVGNLIISKTVTGGVTKEEAEGARRSDQGRS